MFARLHRDKESKLRAARKYIAFMFRGALGLYGDGRR
jgi:hypothetical protein